MCEFNSIFTCTYNYYNTLLLHDCIRIRLHTVLGDLRLVADNFTSSSLSAGRLEIFIKGEWGTICDNKFGSVEADVACRQLGYSSALQYGNNLGYVIYVCLDFFPPS